MQGQGQQRHRWVDDDPARGFLSRLTEQELLLPPVLAHRRLRGPYTAAGTIVRALVPDALDRTPELVRAHATEILSSAPELDGVLSSRYHRPPSVLPGEQTTRFFSRLRTLRLAHGLAEFLRDYASATAAAAVSLVLRQADEADDTDAEFIAVLLRRLDPRSVRLVVSTTAAPAAASALGLALARYAEAWPAGQADPPDPSRTDPSRTGCGRRPATDLRELAAEFVAADCIGSSQVASAARAAYDDVPEAIRRELHDARLAKLKSSGEFSFSLGAIPYHAERGSDPRGTGAAALRAALSYCIDMGFYLAAVDFGQRLRAVVDWSADPQARYLATTKLATALIALSRPAQAEDLYEEVRRGTSDPGIHMSTAYATGILLTRHYPEDDRDHQRARGWLNEAFAIASLMPDSERLLLQHVFNKVGLALVENHLGNRLTALRLTSEGLALLPSGPGNEYGLHQSVLHLRRVQIYTGLGQLDEAVAEYRAVLAEDPDYPEYHLELGNLLRRLGRDDEALIEYETVIRISPPFAEAHYNRADIWCARGDLEAALKDFNRVIELDPDYADAHVNAAGILLSLGDDEAASLAVAAGLAVAPDDSHLLCLRAQLDLETGSFESAQAALDRAAATDPDLAEIWAMRGALAFETGRLTDALADLSIAWEKGGDPTVLLNRGLVNEALGNWKEAVEDFGRVIEQAEDEEDGWLHRAACRARTGDLAGAASDAHRFVALAPDRASEVAALDLKVQST
jgi:tetratricopeptide (TPR) repeat protein